MWGGSYWAASWWQRSYWFGAAQAMVTGGATWWQAEPRLPVRRAREEDEALVIALLL